MIVLRGCYGTAEERNQAMEFRKGSVEYICCGKKRGAIHELIEKAPVFACVGDRTALEEAVIEREMIANTGLGDGIAIAHGRSDIVQGTILALGVSREGIDYDAPDGKPVRLLFLIANNPALQEDYLRTLAVVARMAGSPQFRRRLLDAVSTIDIERDMEDAFRVSGCVGGLVFQPG